jgi:crotonobetainyl-CoA:carnitine CoA-transferase CaiB-like acyl-CoA transferase
LLQAPYGIYESSDGHVAIAMGKLQELFELFKIDDTSLLDEAFDNRKLV